jgi:hypothetical protein
MLDKIKSAVEFDDHFAVDDGSGQPFRVAKAALSPAMADRVRRLYCGGEVKRFAAGGFSGATPLVDDTPPDLTGAPVEPPVGLPVITSAPAPVEAAPGPVVAPPPVTTTAPAPVVAETPPAPTPVEVAVPAAAPVETPATPAPAAPAAPVAPVAAVAPAPASTAALPVSEIPTATAAVEPAAMPEAIDVATQLKQAAAKYMPSGATAADVAAVAPLAEARVAREAAAEKERRAAVEIARLAAVERERDRAAAEQEAAELTTIARNHEEAKKTAIADLNTKATAYRDTETLRVDAGNMWSDMGPFNTSLAAFSMLLGGAVSGITGRSNAAADVIEGAINRNIEEQRRDIAAKRSIRLKEYEAAGATLSQASELLRADMLNLQAAKARSIAAQQTLRTTRDAFTMLAATLDAKRTAAVETALNDMGAAAVSASLAKRAVLKDDLQVKGEQQRQRLAANADRRADAALALDREKLRLDQAKIAAAQRAAGLQEQMALAGRLGQELAPEQWARIGDEKEREKYIAVTTDKGTQAYRLAQSAKDAEELRKLNSAVSQGLTDAASLGKFIGKDAPTILPGTEAKANAEALRQKLIMSIKDIQSLGALTSADMGLVEPLIPDPQSWTSTDNQEAAALKQLTDSFRLLRKLAMKNKLVLSAEERNAMENEVRAEVGAPPVGAPAAPAAASASAPAAAPSAAAPRQVGVDARGVPVYAGAPAEVPGFGAFFSNPFSVEAQERRAVEQRAAAAAAKGRR